MLMQMTCPKCHGDMRQYERSGVTIDQCTECRGIFLDRGELEKLFDAEANWQNAQRQAKPSQAAPPPPSATPVSGYVPPPPPHSGGHVQPGYGQPAYPSHVPPPPPAYPAAAPAYGYHGHYGHRGHHGHYRRRKGFLHDLFD